MRRLMDFLPLNNRKKPPVRRPTTPTASRKALDTLIPDNPNKPYDMKELILKIVDEGDFFEIQEAFAKNIITGFAPDRGPTVGVVANQPMVLAGVLDIDAPARPRASCASATPSNIPLLTFVDVPGFLPGHARNTTASSSTAPSCCSPMARRRCRRSR
jgi:propionyl-CoA carboxylase beta chain